MKYLDIANNIIFYFFLFPFVFIFFLIFLLLASSSGHESVVRHVRQLKLFVMLASNNENKGTPDHFDWLTQNFFVGGATGKLTKEEQLMVSEIQAMVDQHPVGNAGRQPPWMKQMGQEIKKRGEDN